MYHPRYTCIRVSVVDQEESKSERRHRPLTADNNEPRRLHAHRLYRFVVIVCTGTGIYGASESESLVQVSYRATSQQRTTAPPSPSVRFALVAISLPHHCHIIATSLPPPRTLLRMTGTAYIPENSIPPGWGYGKSCTYDRRQSICTHKLGDKESRSPHSDLPGIL